MALINPCMKIKNVLDQMYSLEVSAVALNQLLRFQFEARGKFTRKRQSEKITKRVWFYQGWALLMGAGLERNIQRGCQRPFGTVK